ncbi:MAG: class I SAM-dependent methyltransferase [Anaerolineales bacterium]|nr:class I SAM-dependent methyltransferase [Anaerolineales bacterium]
MDNLPSLYQDKDHLRCSQYKDSSNLNARAELHRRFSTASVDWFTWVLDKLALTANMQVLEVGAGPGWLWRRHLHRIPVGCQITLTDFSPGMVSEAEAALLGTNGQFQFRVANVEELPFSDEQFDVVVANHMLYHVPDLNKGLQEIRRVLRPGGRLVAATNGNTHLQELNEIGRKVFPELLGEGRQSWAGLAFGLENGRFLLAPWFNPIEQYVYDDSLLVNEVEPLVAYMFSTIASQAVDQAQSVEKLRRYLSQRLDEEGIIHITKSTGLFVAHKVGHFAVP